MLRAIIFDMDGVVINSEPAHVRAEKQLFRKLGITPTGEDWAYFVGRGSEDIMAYLKEKYSLKAGIDEMVREKRHLYRAFGRSQVTLMDGFRKLVRELFGTYHFAMTTSSSREDTEFVLDRFTLRDLFEAVVTVDDVTNAKPHPEPYARTAELLGLKPGQCVVIEDAVNGLISARKAGTATIGLASTFHRDTLASYADAVAESLSEIPERLSRLQKAKRY